MVPRKLFHIICGSVIPLIYMFSDKKTALIVTGVFLVLQGIFDVLRIKGLIRIPFVDRNTKEEEKRKPQGSFFFILGCFITIIFFEKEIAVASLFVLSIADPFSSLVGAKFGRLRFLGKSLEGALTFFVCAYILLRLFSFDVTTAAICAVAASLAEYFSTRYLDDNLSIPIVSAFVLTIIKSL